MKSVRNPMRSQGSDITKTTSRLGLKRETLKRLSALAPEQLAQVAGGWGSQRCHSGGSKYC